MASSVADRSSEELCKMKDFDGKKETNKMFDWDWLLWVTFLEATAGAYEAEDLASIDQVIPDWLAEEFWESWSCT